MDEDVDNELKLRVKRALCDLIIVEWHMKHNNKDYKSRRNNDENGQVLLGLRHSYNLMKHNMDFYKIHRQEGASISNIVSFIDIRNQSSLAND